MAKTTILRQMAHILVQRLMFKTKCDNNKQMLKKKQTRGDHDIFLLGLERGEEPTV